MVTLRAPAAEDDHLGRLTDLAGQVDGVVAIRYRPGDVAAAPVPEEVDIGTARI